MAWTRCEGMEDTTVHRWLENDEGGIISVVTENPRSRLGIDGEIRCSWVDECFAIPCSLSVVTKMSNQRIVNIVERMKKRRKILVVDRVS